MTYAFVLDVSACSGCKACQAACKDKNHLPLGVLWRRVYEVSGGAWKPEGVAWSNTVFAYNLSLSCNHCAHTKCAEVCPVDAYVVREDGIVILDSSKCIGCGYCAWACPYGAPQYDRVAGHMTKCNFCYDNLALGLPPACVSACPMRVLDYAEVNDGQNLASDRVALWEIPAAGHPYPMPDNSLTQPHLVIKPHAAMKFLEEKIIANREEVYPQKASGWEEAPLVAFTLLIQMAVGGFWAMLWLFRSVDLQFLPVLLIGLCLSAGLMSSFAHLGTKRNAWRVLNHLRKSWLSSRNLVYNSFRSRMGCDPDKPDPACQPHHLHLAHCLDRNWIDSLHGSGLSPAIDSCLGFMADQHSFLRERRTAWHSWNGSQLGLDSYSYVSTGTDRIYRHCFIDHAGSDCKQPVLFYRRKKTPVRVDSGRHHWICNSIFHTRKLQIVLRHRCLHNHPNRRNCRKVVLLSSADLICGLPPRPSKLLPNPP